MQIVHYNNIDFQIDEKGVLRRAAAWRVMPDESTTTDWENLSDRVKAWAGNIGDPWRVPSADAKSFTPDDRYTVSDIKVKALSRYTYEVEFSGTARNIAAAPLGEPEIKVNQSGEKEKTLRWRIHADSLDGFLPETGDPVRLAGEL